MFDGLFQLPWWGYLVFVLFMTHVTIVAVTVYLHRCQAHRALDLHPIVSHFFRFWLWLTTGMQTRQWAAVHRKHHARCETAEDPHSPQVLGLRKVLGQGAELFRLEAARQETLDRYGKGTPDDWLERSLYSRHPSAGVGLMLAADVVAFGPIGITLWAVQMIWIPFFAAGVINGIGHYWGYRNFEAADASRNILPWGILIGGEELHNNHHAYAASARLSSKWYEFDIGWMYIRILQWVRLATVRKVAPGIRFVRTSRCDLDTLQAIITHRFDVMGNYGRMLKLAYREEFSRLQQVCRQYGREPLVLERLKRWLIQDAERLQDQERQVLTELLQHSSDLRVLYQFRQELAAVWARSSASQEQLLKTLEDWCRRAEASGIEALQQFSLRLRCYRLA
jgi:stearoyl-CoA desaturase (delta-9 desaturase)